MKECYEAFNIPRSILTECYNGRINRKEMGPRSVLIKNEEEKFVNYMNDMLRLGHPLILADFKIKVAEITQLRATPFKDGVLDMN